MSSAEPQGGDLRAELEETRARLREAEEALYAIRAGKVDAIVRSGPHVEEIVTLGDTPVLYRALLEVIGEGAVLLTPEGTIVYCNTPFAQLVQRSLEDVAGADFREFVAPAEKPRFEMLLTQARQGIGKDEFKLRGPNGSPVAVQLSIRFPQGDQRENACMVVTDITEHKRAEEQVRELNATLARRIANLVEASVEAVLSVDFESRITDVNEQTCVLTGFAREELIGSAFAALFTDAARAAEYLRKVRGERVVKDFELSVSTQGGKELAVELSAAVFDSSAGEPLGFFIAVRDVGERQGAERERSLLAAIVQSSDDAIYSVTPDTVVTSWNLAAERLYGFTAQEMLDRSIAICVPLELRVQMLEHVSLAVRERKGLRQFETRRRRKDASLIDVSISMSPIVGEGGEVIGAAIVARDIGERRRFEQELTRARDAALETTRMKSEFLANMSHEIRTPLNAIMGMTTMLLDAELSEEQKECARGVQESSQALLSIINDVLDFSKIAAGKLALEEIDFELESTLGAALDLVAEQAQRKGLEVAVQIEPHAPRLLRGDPGRVRQVLANLLSNAVKFTEQGEVVVRVSTLSESSSEATLRFEVRDTGIGIPEEGHGQLFHAFSQVDVSDSREHGGTGLGLAIAHELVERMGGTIGVQSELGVGSTFWFMVKFAKQSPHAQAPFPDVAELEGLRILVVDDSATNREILKHQLMFWKMAADVAPEAEEALRMLRAQAQQGAPFKVALLDQYMPVTDGLELARRIRDEPAIAGTPLIMVSSMNIQGSHRAAASGLDLKAWLLKPVKPSDLYNALIEVIAPRGAALSAGLAPAEQATPSLTAAIKTLGARERKLHALVTEDNILNKRVALWHVEKLGFIADAVTNGEQVLEALARRPYDVVLMDCRMPKMDGYEATRQIRRREGAARHTKIIAMTAHALIGDREKCLAAGMDDYISKPIKMDDLVAALGRVLGPRVDASMAQEFAVAPTGADGGPVGSPLPVDPATMASLRGQGELLGKLVAIFIKEVPEQLTQIATSLAQQDGENAAITAHGLKGSAAIFGAARMRELAGSVEQSADHRAFDGARTDLESLRAECERVRGALEAERT